MFSNNSCKCGQIVVFLYTDVPFFTASRPAISSSELEIVYWVQIRKNFIEIDLQRPTGEIEVLRSAIYQQKMQHYKS